MIEFLSDVIVRVSHYMTITIEDVGKLTLTQVRSFMESIVKIQKEELKVLAATMRVSALGDKHAFSEFMQDLNTLPLPVRREERQIKPSEDFDWKKDDKIVKLQTSNKPKEYFSQYFERNKIKKKEDI